MGMKKEHKTCIKIIYMYGYEKLFIFIVVNVWEKILCWCDFYEVPWLLFTIFYYINCFSKYMPNGYMPNGYMGRSSRHVFLMLKSCWGGAYFSISDYDFNSLFNK